MTFDEFLKQNKTADLCFYRAQDYLKEGLDKIAATDGIHHLEINLWFILEAGKNLAKALNQYHVVETNHRLEEIKGSNVTDGQTRETLMARKIELEEMAKELKTTSRISIRNTLSSREASLRDIENGTISESVDPEFAFHPLRKKSDEINSAEFNRAELNSAEMLEFLSEMDAL